MRLVMATAVGLLCLLGGAFAAGPFDGIWHGTIEPSGSACVQGAIAMRITDTEIAGRFSLGGAQIPFRGTVGADGGVNASFNIPSHGASGSMTGKISGTDFAGRLETNFQTTRRSCTRNVTAKHD